MQRDSKRQTSRVAALAEKLYFNLSYRFGFAEWDINAAQPDLIRLVDKGLLKGKTILDIGCGSGDNAIYLASKGFKVTGLDYSKTGIEEAKKRSKRKQFDIHFRVHDAFRLTDLNQQFDIILDYGLYHNIKPQDLAAYVKNLGSVTRKGGQLILQCFSCKSEPRNFGPRQISEQEIENSFSKGWKLQQFIEAQYITPKAKIPSIIAIINKD